MNLNVASYGASFAIQGQRETWSCNREFESFSSIDCLNGKAGSKICTHGWGKRENERTLFPERVRFVKVPKKYSIRELGANHVRNSLNLVWISPFRLPISMQITPSLPIIVFVSG